MLASVFNGRKNKRVGDSPMKVFQDSSIRRVIVTDFQLSQNFSISENSLSRPGELGG